MRKKSILLFILAILSFVTVSNAFAEDEYKETKAGGRNYWNEEYYNLYNQLCPAPIWYIDIETIKQMLLVQDSNCSVITDTWSSETENTEKNTEENPFQDKETKDEIDDLMTQIIDMMLSDDEKKWIKKPIYEYVEKEEEKEDKQQTGSEEFPIVVYSDIKTYPSQWDFCVSCHINEENEVYWKITLHDAEWKLLEEVWEMEWKDKEIIKTDFIYIRPEDLYLYLNIEELINCIKD